MKQINTSISQSPCLSDILGKPISKKEALALIQGDYDSYQTFLRMSEQDQENILEFIQGNRCIQITYDGFFKKIMDPFTHPQRLEHFLSAILAEPITNLTVLPHEGTKLSDSGSLVIMDMVVETSDKKAIDVEMQKLGYRFPGERSDCYCADFIMRQYNRVRGENREKFTFEDLNPFTLIILMEKSAPEFRAVSPHYLHKEIRKYDSGAEVNYLTQTIYISLDTFRKVVQNIDNELHAWLTFLSSNDSKDIIRLVTAYPEFLSCYQDITEYRKTPRELINMYSEALAILDRNTVKYMCEEQQKEIEELKAEKAAILAEKDSAIAAISAEKDLELQRAIALLKQHGIEY